MLMSSAHEVLALDMEDVGSPPEPILSIHNPSDSSRMAKIIPLDAHDAIVIDGR